MLSINIFYFLKGGGELKPLIAVVNGKAVRIRGGNEMHTLCVVHWHPNPVKPCVFYGFSFSFFELDTQYASYTAKYAMEYELEIFVGLMFLKDILYFLTWKFSKCN